MHPGLIHVVVAYPSFKGDDIAPAYGSAEKAAEHFIETAIKIVWTGSYIEPRSARAITKPSADFHVNSIEGVFHLITTRLISVAVIEIVSSGPFPIRVDMVIAVDSKVPTGA